MKVKKVDEKVILIAMAGTLETNAQLAAELYPGAEDLKQYYDKYKNEGFTVQETVDLARQEILQGRDAAETMALERMCGADSPEAPVSRGSKVTEREKENKLEEKLWRFGSQVIYMEILRDFQQIYFRNKKR